MLCCILKIVGVALFILIGVVAADLVFRHVKQKKKWPTKGSSYDK